MKISIVIPVYNVPARLLEECLHAAARQTLRRDEFEIIIVDDCSTASETLKVVSTLASAVPNVQVVRHTENRGLNEARRTGVKAAVGDYVVFVDGDDILTRDAIENLRMAAHSSNADLVTAPFFRWGCESKSYADRTIVGKAMPTNYVDRLRAVLRGDHSFTMCGRLFRRELLDDEIFDLPQGQLHEDVTTFVRVLFRTKIVNHVGRNIYYYTINPKSITSNFSENHAVGMFCAFEDWLTKAERANLRNELLPSMAIGVEKLVNVCIERCASSDNMKIDEQIRVLQNIDQRYSDLDIARISPTLKGTKFLAQFEVQDFSEQSERVAEAIRISFPRSASAEAGPVLPKGMQPSDMARRLKDKVVFIGQVDYQIRNAAAFARELRLRGHPCVVMDNSSFASGGLRQLPPEERRIFWRTEHIKVAKGPYETDWLSTAKLVICFNDFNDDFREALEYRNRLSLPSVCVVEGINDFLRTDFDGYRHLPYRRCDYVFVSGKDDLRYFEDRKTYIAGLPVIETLSEKVPSFPRKPTAVLNVNFTYGVLENERKNFIDRATKAFAEAGVDYVITQHPMDKSDLKGLPVSTRTQYELIDESTVFVSRFATGILEALASGKPAVYFNPHGEKVEKFKSPMGAFEVATTEGELAQALRRVIKDVEAGVDFRKRALSFLEHHTAYRSEGPSVLERFADAVGDVLKNESGRGGAAAQLFFDHLNTQEPFLQDGPGQIFGRMDRRHKAQLNEEELIGRYFGSRDGIMIDVGANFGNSLDIYLGKGWTVHAFEPDPNNRRRLLESWPSCSRLTVNEQAVSDKAGLKLPFFASDESTGISGLSAFTAGHRQVCEVTTTTLRDYYETHQLRHVEFLKIDVEGYDKFVLDGFPWEKDQPDVVLAEFEDEKTVPLGYTVHDLAKTLVDRGYSVYVSEWLPILRYGIAHDWARLVRYSPDLDVSKTWGNVIGFLRDPDEADLKTLVQETVKFVARPVSEKTPESPTEKAQSKSVPSPAVPYQAPERAFYAGFGEWLEPRSPNLFRLLQRMRRTVGRGMPSTPSELAVAVRARTSTLFRLGQVVTWTVCAARRHKFLTLLVAAVCIGLLVLPAFYHEAWARRFGFWGAAVLLILLSVSVATLGEAFRRVLRAQEAALSAVRLSIRDQNLQIKELRGQLRDLSANHDQAMRASRAEVAALKSDLKTKDTLAGADVQKIIISQPGGRELSSRSKAPASGSKRQ